VYPPQSAMATHRGGYDMAGACRCDECVSRNFGGHHHQMMHPSVVNPYAPTVDSTNFMAAPMYPPYPALSQINPHDFQFPQLNQSIHQRATNRTVETQPQEAREVPVTDESFQKIVGQMYDISRTSGGSSFLQACLKDKECDRFEVIYSELHPHFAELLLDSHGCYVMRSLMEKMSMDQMKDILQTLTNDEQLIYSLCTHSLHTRRIVQYLLETIRVECCPVIVDVMVKQCREIATTQQGCIAMQRVMDCATDEQNAPLYAKIYENLMEFSHDPFANYVIQYILEKGDKAATSQQVWSQFQGQVTPLACNKFASNVVEKALHHTTPEVQHLIVSELYSNTAEFLQGMLQDSFGNYIVQATIALCSFKDVWMISEKLKPILHTTPYGYKIAARLERRLKGKPLTNARTVTYTHQQHLRS
jgi:hypothetical protein